ncbi:MAG: SpoIID/LytB domain-containing protein [Culturomica sp.]|jgi:SpoIID/LytB domain protein|nr:SpoIID/LytB domain-containing protein [Culturomica sp.]
MKISVGILAANQVNFFLNGEYICEQTKEILSGAFTLKAETLSLNSSPVNLPLTFTPVNEDKSDFELADVVIGIDFHWERKEKQCFKGALHFIPENGLLRVVNIIDIEDYLLSVISSEMSATSSLELLKSHAIISRSWLIAQIEKSRSLVKQQISNYHYNRKSQKPENENERIIWFDREDHSDFDVCADDHCQRYQGISRISTPLVEQAVKETCGIVLMYDGEICDARFSKCCGGVSENFENVWEPIPHEYLTSVYDGENTTTDLSDETTFKKWLTNSPNVFCNTTDKHILSDVLNDYDLETANFFRWEVHYTQKEISQLIKERLSVDFGAITDLIPLERGVSGRLIRLKICGELREMIIGKELLIRKALSRSHLYSSAFIVEKITENGTIKGFTLKGAGWGHGVGLCQIGAAVMGHKGYTYKEILMHYFKGAELKNISDE